MVLNVKEYVLLIMIINLYIGFAEKVSPKFMPLLTKNFLTNQ